MVFRSFKIFLTVFFLFSIGKADALGTKHPVLQLVEWELFANAGIQRTSRGLEDTIETMATAILERISDAEIPVEIRKELGVNLKKFRNGDEFERYAIVGELDEELTKKIVLMPAPIEYLEIPVDVLSQAGRLFKHQINVESLPLAKEYMMFQRNGKDYIRWYIHPLAEKEELDIFKILEEVTGETPKVKKGFAKFHFTASRSLVLFRQSYDDAISVKLSLPLAPGEFKDKRIRMNELSAWCRHNTYISTVLNKKGTEHLNFLYEPLGLGISTKTGFEDGMLFRDLSLLKRGYYLMPAFAIFNRAGGIVSEKNNSENSNSWWKNHFITPFAKGMAEFRALTGEEHTSAHSQNVLAILDSDFKPTQQVALRDSDFYADEVVFDQINTKIKNKKGLVSKTTQGAFFILQNGLPENGVLNAETYKEWITDYFNIYKKRFSEVTGYPESSIFVNSKSSSNAWDPIYRNSSEILDGGYLAFNDHFFTSESKLEWLNSSKPTVSAQPTQSVNFCSNLFGL